MKEKTMSKQMWGVRSARFERLKLQKRIQGLKHIKMFVNDTFLFKAINLHEHK